MMTGTAIVIRGNKIQFYSAQLITSELLTIDMNEAASSGPVLLT